jgi:ribulose-5-phosphate 4-epimerase/fuculose-1-phosphate aldolase
MTQSAIKNHEADDIAVTRAELACAFRWTARLDMHEATANHFSAAVSDDGHEFLMNREGFHFSEIRASDLALVDSRASEEPEGLDPTAWAIHGAIHRNNPEVRCVLHTHARASTALACLEDPTLPPVDQNAMRFFERVAIDTGFNGMGLDEEAERLSHMADADTPILLLGNHGVIALGDSVAQAFDNLYYFERACETWLTVLSTGRRYSVVEPEVARLTAQQWEAYPEFARNHFDALMRKLDREEPEFRE